MSRTIGLLLFPGVEVLDFAGPWEVLGVAAPRSGDKLLAIGETREPVVSAQALRFLPDATLDESPQLDVILVPGGMGTREPTIRPVVEFVRRQAPGAEIIASVCTGAFVLQEAGLLAGRRAATHWASRDRLRELGVDVSDERYVVDGNIWTSAGVSAGIDMALALAGHLYGEETGRRVQKSIEYEPAPPFAVVI